jgi:hypothetical protein
MPQTCQSALLTWWQPIHTAETDLSVPGSTLVEREYSVAVTGDAFRWLIDYGNEDVLNKVCSCYIQWSKRIVSTDFDIGACIRKGICQNVTGRKA